MSRWPILTSKETKKKVRKKKNILEAAEGREISEDELIDRAVDELEPENGMDRLLEDVFK